jgi:hypothetical protein
MFCFGIGVSMFSIKCFVLELPSLCSWVNILLWSWYLYVPCWIVYFAVGVSMLLVDCFALELASSCSWLIVLFWSWHLYVPSWMLLFLELASICSYLNVLISNWHLYVPSWMFCSWRLYVPGWLFCLVCLFFWCFWLHFQQYFSYIVGVSFIGRGNWRTRRKPPTCRKSLINVITKLCMPRSDLDSNTQHQLW